MTSTTQKPLPDNTQHSKETDLHAPGGIRTRNPSKGGAANPRFSQRDHWDRNPYHIPIYIYICVCVCVYLCISVTCLLYPTSRKLECCDIIYWKFPIIYFVEYAFFSDSRSFTCEEIDMHGKAEGSVTVPVIGRRQELIGPTFNVV